MEKLLALLGKIELSFGRKAKEPGVPRAKGNKTPKATKKIPKNKKGKK